MGGGYRGANVPRMERARRPPKAGNRAHIPRAIASREAMLWQGCSLSPRELERKPLRSVWATPLPASRPIRWIVRESREAHRADTIAPRPWGRMCLGQGQRALAPPTDGHPPAFRNPQRQFSHYATAFQLRYGRNQPPLNHFPNHPTTAFQPRPNHRKPQPLHNRPSAARRTIPRLAKTHDSTILRGESKNDSDATIHIRDS